MLHHRLRAAAFKPDSGPSSLSLLHLDTNTNDAYGLTWTLAGGAAIQGTIKKFGDGALHTNASGNGDARCTALTGFPATLTDFTFECFFRVDSANSSRTLFGIIPSGGSPRWSFYRRSSNILTVYNATDGVLFTFGDNVTTGEWHHAAFTREGSTLRVFLDGELSDSRTNSRAIDTDGAIYLGQSGLDSEYWPGYIDEVRISDFCRYNAPFTPPTSPFES